MSTCNLRHNRAAMIWCSGVVAIGVAALASRSSRAEPPGSGTLPAHETAAAPADNTPDISKEEFAGRRAQVYEGIGDDIAVLCGFYASPNEYRRHRQHNNFYYLTGVEIPNCALLLDGRARHATLFVMTGRGGATTQELERLGEQTGIERVVAANQFGEIVQAVAKGRARVFLLTAPDEGFSQSRDSFFSIGQAASAIPGDPAILRAKQFRDGVTALVPDLQAANLQNVIDPLRRVKSPSEIKLMREAARIGAIGIADAIRGTRPGILERELEGIFELACLRLGAHGSAWTPIVATGPKITEFHYFENSRRIAPGEMILLDAGPDYRYYCSDLTRVWPASGPYPPRYRELYDKLLEVHKATIAAMKPGVTVNELGRVLRESAKTHGIEQYIVGGAGHYTGMAPHDNGDYRAPFVPGVVFNIEPLLVVGNESLHIRFEDTVLCTETGSEVLTPLDLLPWEADKLLEMRDGGKKQAGR